MKILNISRHLFVLLMFAAVTYLTAEDSEMTIEELRALRDELKAKNEALKSEIEKEDQTKELSISEESDIEDNQKKEEQESFNIATEEISEETAQNIEEEPKSNSSEDIKEKLVIEKDGYKKKTVILDNESNSEITTISITKKSDLEEEIEELKEQLEEAKEELEELKEDIDEEIEEGKEEVAELKEDLDEAIEEAKEHSTAAFIFMPEVKWLDIDPLQELVKIDNSLKGKVFDFSKDVMPNFNFAGYADVDGKGLRVGQKISFGYKSFLSDDYTGMHIDTAGDTTAIDSMIRLHVIPVSVGFMFEKAFTINPVSFYSGFTLGGGALMVVQERLRANPETMFFDSDDDIDKDEDDDGLSFIAAPSIDWDIHFGSSVKLKKGFSLGLEGVFDFSYAFYGFGTGHNDYLTWSPGIRLRLGFGNGC